MAAGGSRPAVVLFGDSLTQFSFGEGGWGASVANAYQRRADVLNRGLSGYNTRWALEVMEGAFPAVAPSPALVTIFFGANDSALPDRGSARQHVPVEEYAANLAAMVSFLRDQRQVGAVLLITPPPVDEAARLAYIRELEGAGPGTELPERTNETAGCYAEACCNVARSADCPVLNLWEGFQALQGWEELLSDGLHFTPEGQRALWAQLNRLIESDSRLSGVLPASMPLDFPLHRDIDPANPSASIKAHKPQ